MARSTTGTTKEFKSATMSGIFNNHAALAGIGTVLQPDYVPAQLCREREFLGYDNRAYQPLTHLTGTTFTFLRFSSTVASWARAQLPSSADLLSSSQSAPQSNRYNRQTTLLFWLPHAYAICNGITESLCSTLRILTIPANPPETSRLFNTQRYPELLIDVGAWQAVE